jgi:hypothetical protein
VSIAYQVFGDGPIDLVSFRGATGDLPLVHERTVRETGRFLVSSTVKDLVAGSGIEFEDRGSHEPKGVPGEWRLLAVLP